MATNLERLKASAVDRGAKKVQAAEVAKYMRPVDSGVSPPTGQVALVFTDIQGSTYMWDTAPDAVKHSLAMHNVCIRKLIKEHRGYEVKTEGDAFMVAFQQPVAAASFCLAVQIRLLDIKWPDDLFQFPQCVRERSSDNTTTIWNGLRVRMGIHYGSPIAEIDPVHLLLICVIQHPFLFLNLCCAGHQEDGLFWTYGECQCKGVWVCCWRSGDHVSCSS